jgi:hypothetical protein
MLKESLHGGSAHNYCGTTRQRKEANSNRECSPVRRSTACNPRDLQLAIITWPFSSGKKKNRSSWIMAQRGPVRQNHCLQPEIRWLYNNGLTNLKCLSTSDFRVRRFRKANITSLFRDISSFTTLYRAVSFNSLPRNT